MAAILLIGAQIAPAEAQTELPGIRVTSPSPVVRRPTPPPAPAAAPSGPPAEAAATPPPSDLNPVPGTLIVDDESFASVTVSTKPDVEMQSRATITDTLQNKPGITGSTFAAGANRPIIRGLDNTRVRVQENGLSSGDMSTLSEDHAVPIDPYAADRIEVVRGPATLRYGSQAIGGVVAVENERIPTFLPPRGWLGEVRGGLSSVDRGRDGGFSVTAGAAGFAFHADGFERHTGDYDTPHGRQLNTFSDGEGFSVGGSYIGRDGYAGVSLTRYSTLYGIPGEEAATARPRIDLEQTKLQSKGEWRVRDYGVEAIRYWFGASDYAHNELDFDADRGRDIIGSRFTNKEQEARIEVQHLPVMTGLGELRGAVGAQWGHKKLAGVAVEDEADGILDPARQQSVAAFIFEELQLTRALRLQFAGRIEQAKVNGTALDFDDPLNVMHTKTERTFRPVSGGVGLLYDLPLDVVARLNGQYVERAPEAQELFSKGAHDATGTFEIGNPDLSKEKARTVEFGFKRAKGDFRFDASAYYTTFDGFIFKQLTGGECGVVIAECPIAGGAPSGADTLKEVLFSQRDATFRGAELVTEYDIAPIWRGVWGVDAQYDFVIATFGSGFGNVPRIPPHRLGGGIYYRDKNWVFRVGTLHAFRQDRVATTETETSGYTLLNAEASYRFRFDAPGGVTPEMRIGLRGDNLLDDDVRNHVSFKKDEMLLPGASVRLFGSIKFN
jgi:iron complex outermembrane receptor protein